MDFTSLFSQMEFTMHHSVQEHKDPILGKHPFHQSLCWNCIKLPSFYTMFVITSLSLNLLSSPQRTPKYPKHNPQPKHIPKIHMESQKSSKTTN